jgi:outer membrane murein-binding lipoprotein Lpp
MQPAFDKNPTPSPTGKSGSNKTIIIVMGAIIALLLIAGGFLFYDNTEKTDTIVQKEKDIENLDSEIKELEKELSAKENELTTTTNEKEELLNQLKNLQDKITYYKVRAEKLMTEGAKSKEEIEKLKGNLDQLRYYDEKNKIRIRELEDQIQVLKTQVTELQGTVEQQKGTIQQLGDEVETGKIKIEAGSKLQAAEFTYKFDYKGLFGSKSSENYEGQGSKAKRTNKITVNCNIMKNSIAQQGNRNFYILIKSPSGKLYQNMNTVSGYFKSEGKDLGYTTRVSANYTGNQLPISFEYQRAEKDEFEKGQHTIQIYAQSAPGADNAYLIGTDVFMLK